MKYSLKSTQVLKSVLLGALCVNLKLTILCYDNCHLQEFARMLVFTKKIKMWHVA